MIRRVVRELAAWLAGAGIVWDDAFMAAKMKGACKGEPPAKQKAVAPKSGKPGRASTAKSK